MKHIFVIATLLLVSMSLVQAQEPVYRLSFNNTLANAVGDYQNPVATGDPVFATSLWGGENEALRLDGANDYLDLGTAVPGLNGESLITGTISFWLKHNSAVTSQVIFGTFNTGNAEGLDLRYNNNTRLEMFLRASSPGGLVSLTGSADFPPTVDGDWRHVVITWNFTDEREQRTVQIYLDGIAEEMVLFNSDTGTQDITFRPWEFPITMGARNNRGAIGVFANVTIDDFRVYEDVLTPAQVLDIVPVEISAFTLD